MKSVYRIPLIVVLAGWIFMTAALASAHTVNYEVQQKGLAVKIFYTAQDPASYAEYEVFGPGEELPHQTGRTDRNGFVAFVPDKQGVWKIKVLGESAHGYHGVTTEVKVDKDLGLESFNKPLVARFTKFVTGISLIIGIFGIYALIVSRKKQLNGASGKSSN
jgi:nickel transport protein